MNNNNPMRLEFLIDSMKEHTKEAETILDQIEGNLKQLRKLNDKHHDEIQTSQPVNPKTIKTYVDRSNQATLEFLNTIKIEQALEALDTYRANLKQLDQYYQQEYLKRLEDN